MQDAAWLCINLAIMLADIHLACGGRVPCADRLETF
jgi:hypothetical protein